MNRSRDIEQFAPTTRSRALKGARRITVLSGTLEIQVRGETFYFEAGKRLRIPRGQDLTVTRFTDAELEVERDNSDPGAMEFARSTRSKRARES